MIKKVLSKLQSFIKPSQKTLGARAIVIDNGRVLLVKHTYLNGWYTVGGGVERGESTLEAVRRELQEEVGLEMTETPKILGVYHNTREDRDDYVTVYVCNSFQKKSVSSLEIAEEKWFPINDLPDDISPATKRRIEEYQGKRSLSDKW